MRRVLSLLACLPLLGVSAEECLPIGDGVHDDTAAIQALLDKGTSLVSLPAPVKEYVISRPLLIGDGQELRLGRFSRIRPADGSNCRMLSNRDPIRGNRDIAVVGGVWDMNNLGQRHNLAALFWMDKKGRRLWLNEERERVQEQKIVPSEGFDYERFSGVCFRFFKVTGLVLRDVTVRNPTIYGMQFWKVSDFLIDGIRFDYAWGNPAKANMDGLHFDGCCCRGRISNLSGTCFDDFVALNATDGCAPSNGPISDIDIDGINCDYCHSAVRLLSRTPEDAVRRITIRNVRGRYYSYGIGLTYFGHEYPTKGVMDGITISDCHLSRADGPADMWQFGAAGAVEVERGIDVGELNIARFWREEDQCPERATVRLAEDATVRRLVLRDCVQVNRTREPMAFLHNRGKIGELAESGTRLVDSPGPNVRCETKARAETWDDPWRTIGGLAELAHGVRYPERGATDPSGSVTAGFGERMLRVFPFTSDAGDAHKASVDPYSVGGYPGICLAEYPSVGVRAEATVSSGVGWFRLRYPENAPRGLAVAAKCHVAFSEPVESVETRGDDRLYRFRPGRDLIVAKVSEREIPSGGFDFDRTAFEVRRAWNRARDLASYVNVLKGASGDGQVRSSAARPFGTMRAGPNTGDVGLTPYVGNASLPPSSWPVDRRTERAAPGYYSVERPDDGLAVEIAATRHAAIYRIAGDGVRPIRLLVDIGAGTACAAEGDESAAAASVKTNGCVLSGSFRKNGRAMAFAIATDRPWSEIVQPDSRRPRYVLSFPSDETRNLLAKVALSATSAEAAEKNLNEEIAHWDFDRIRREARSDWNRQLSQSRTEGDDETLERFYTEQYYRTLQR